MAFGQEFLPTGWQMLSRFIILKYYYGTVSIDKRMFELYGNLNVD